MWNVILSILRSQNHFHSIEIHLGSQNWQDYISLHSVHTSKGCKCLVLEISLSETIIFMENIQEKNSWNWFFDFTRFFCLDFLFTINSQQNFVKISSKSTNKKFLFFVPGLSCSASPPSSTHLDLDSSNIYENRSCARCNKLYSVFKDTGECVQPEACVYHYGKPKSSSRKYSCCGRRMKTNFSGCETVSSHVWRGILYEISGKRMPNKQNLVKLIEIIEVFHSALKMEKIVQ